MLILHLAARSDRLMLWGETLPELASAEVKPGRGKSPRASAPLSPYAARAEALGQAVRDIASFEPGEPLDEIVWLPSAAAAPLASNPLIAEPPASRAMPKLAAWRVPALELSPENAIVLLCSCPDEGAILPGVVAGPDVTFWRMAMRLAGALAAKQQFLPGLVERKANGDSQFFARWEPVLAGASAQRFSALARVMPHACRAAGGPSSTSPPGRAASAVLAGVMTSFVDAIVRDVRPAAPLTRAQRRRLKPPVHDSIHDQWLAALTSPSSQMEGSERELEQLAGQIATWRHPISVTSGAPFRLCFRLREPSLPSQDMAASALASWRVEYLLQALDDPSLLVPAAGVWKPKSTAAKALAQRNVDARAYLLSSLGQCAPMDRRIEDSLRSPAPDGYVTDAAGAREFLERTAFQAEEAGFAVLLPAWWSRKGTKLRLTASAHVKGPKLRPKAGLTLEAICQVEWRVALGGEELSLKELQTLAKLKAPLVRVRGQWVQLNSDEIQAALAFWKNRGTTASARDVVRMALGGEKSPGGLDLTSVSAGGWVGDLLKQLEGHEGFEELPPPEGFTGTLRPYQARGYSWLAFLRRWGLGACLADDMGLGKTVQTLALVQHVREKENDLRPALLVCPTSVVANWSKESARFTPDLSVLVHHGARRQKGPAFREQAENHALVVSSYALLQRDVEMFQGVEWQGVVLDEAQNVKNPETKQAKAARSLEAGYRIALTGTPVENNVGDLWSILEFLNPGWLGKQSEFRKSFFLPIQTAADPEAAERLKRMTGPFILRRLKTDRSIIADLPEKLEMRVFCTLTKEQATLYQAVVDEATDPIDKAEGIQRRGLVLATLMKLKQVCNHPAQFLGDNSAVSGRSGKLARLTEMLEEALAEGDRALVFTQFSEMGEILKRHLQETFGRETLFLHGGTPKAKRDQMVERFQSKSGPSVFILSLKAGGTGLNLTGANHVFHFDRWWNPAVENQATDRAFRIGQTRNVLVHKFVCAGTLEEKIDEMIERKKDVAERVVGTGEGWLTELSTAELRNLFALKEQ